MSHSGGEPSAADLRGAVRAAAGSLAASQEADGSFALAPVDERPPGGPGDNLFSTATVLALASSLLPPERRARASAYICARRDERGLWAWGSDGALPPDSDDTACCLGALAIVGVALDNKREARVLRRFWRWGGPFKTWLGTGGWNARDRDDVIVNCNILWALRMLGVRWRGAELRKVGRMVAAQRGETRYYCSPASVAWAASRIGLAAPQLSLPGEAELRARPLECALWSIAGRIPAPEAAAWLVDAQEADGGWSPEPWIQDHVGAWQSRPVTTAFALAALTRAAPDLG